MPEIRAIYLDEPQEMQSTPKKSSVRFKEVPEEEESFLKSYLMANPRMAKDLGDAILDRMKKIPEYAESAKTEIPGFFELPADKARNQARAGLAEFGETVFNLPHDFINYATNRLHLFPKDINEKVQMARMPADTQELINQKFGKPEYPGEGFSRGLGKHVNDVLALGGLSKTLMPYLDPRNIPRSLKDTSKLESQLVRAEEDVAGAESLEQQEKNAAMKAGHGTGNVYLLEGKANKANKKLNDLYAQLNEAPPKTYAEQLKAGEDLAKYHQEYNDAKAALDQAKSASVQEVKTSNPDIIQNKINEKQAKLDQLTNDMKNGRPVTDEQLGQAQVELDAAKNEFEQNKNYAESNFGSSKENALQLKINNNANKINELESKLTNQKETPVESALNEENPTFEQKKIPNISEYAENEKRSTSYHENAQQMVNQAEGQIAHHVNENANHAVRASKEMKNEITSINNYWSDAYKALTDKLKKSKFNLTNRMPDIDEFFISTDNGELIDLLKKSPTTKDVSASDFMTKQKEFRDARYDLLKRAKEEPNASKRRELFDAYQKSERVDRIINQTLQDGLGEYLPEYQRVNKGYSEQVFPLRENPIANKIMEGKPMSSDIAHELAGDMEGQTLLREIASRNNEVKRNIMGQQYKKGGKDKSGFYNPDESVREYLNTMPDLNRLMGRRESAINSASESKVNLDRSKALHEEAKVSNARIEKENAQIEKDRIKHEKEQVEKKEARRLAEEKEKAKIAKQKEQDLNEIKALQEKNTLLGGIKQKLAESSEKKGKLESYYKELNDLKTHHENTHQSMNEINQDFKVLNKHLDAIKSAQEKVKGINKPEKVAIGKAPDIKKMKQEISDLHEKLAGLDENIKKLHEAKNNTDLKLSKKLEIQKTLNEAIAMRKEARRRLKVAGTTITGLTAFQFHPTIKDYLLNRKSNESRT